MQCSRAALRRCRSGERERMIVWLASYPRSGNSPCGKSSTTRWGTRVTITVPSGPVVDALREGVPSRRRCVRCWVRRVARSRPHQDASTAARCQQGSTSSAMDVPRLQAFVTSSGSTRRRRGRTRCSRSPLATVTSAPGRIITQTGTARPPASYSRCATTRYSTPAPASSRASLISRDSPARSAAGRTRSRWRDRGVPAVGSRNIDFVPPPD